MFQLEYLQSDSDGNANLIGTTISDSSGQYSFKWTPANADMYKIAATFDGSDSYWGSWAETGLAIEAASAASPTPSTTTFDAINNTTFAVGIIAIIIAVALATVLILRKHP